MCEGVLTISSERRENASRSVSLHPLEGSFDSAQDDRAISAENWGNQATVVFSASCVGSTLSSNPFTFCTTTFSPAETFAEATASHISP